MQKLLDRKRKVAQLKNENKSQKWKVKKLKETFELNTSEKNDAGQEKNLKKLAIMKKHIAEENQKLLEASKKKIGYFQLKTMDHFGIQKHVKRRSQKQNRQTKLNLAKEHQKFIKETNFPKNQKRKNNMFGIVAKKRKKIVAFWTIFWIVI